MSTAADWIETSDGFEHRTGEWTIQRWNTNRITVALYRATEGRVTHILDGDLYEAVDFVDRMSVRV